MKDPNLNENGSVYGAWETEFGDWIIETKGVHCFLLVGEKYSLLIDTAYGEGDLLAVVKKITQKPLIVVNTHGHLDHSGGNGFWEKVWMGKGGEIPARQVDASKLPFPTYEIVFLSDGQIFDLGDRQVEAISIGAHHDSSFAFLDKKNKTLYTGDEVESGQVLLFVNDAETQTDVLVARHLENMKKLKLRSDEYVRLMPAHNGGPLNVDYIDAFIKLDEWILSKEAIPQETVAGFGMPTFLWGGDEKLQRIRLGKASFICAK